MPDQIAGGFVLIDVVCFDDFDSIMIDFIWLA